MTALPRPRVLKTLPVPSRWSPGPALLEPVCACILGCLGFSKTPIFPRLEKESARLRALFHPRCRAQEPELHLLSAVMFWHFSLRLLCVRLDGIDGRRVRQDRATARLRVHCMIFVSYLRCKEAWLLIHRGNRSGKPAVLCIGPPWSACPVFLRHPLATRGWLVLPSLLVPCTRAVARRCTMGRWRVHGRFLSHGCPVIHSIGPGGCPRGPTLPAWCTTRPTLVGKAGAWTRSMRWSIACVLSCHPMKKGNNLPHDPQEPPRRAANCIRRLFLRSSDQPAASRPSFVAGTSTFVAHEHVLRLVASSTTRAHARRSSVSRRRWQPRAHAAPRRGRTCTTTTKAWKNKSKTRWNASATCA
mmetsp:Transcript_3729/g.23407  ORF Transcript_3729/g.23407 Transcript_3729/m.23407 type:complete len:358 (-) Transcript_3729:3300-4373(-)